jgi:hypothetical protein
VFSKYVTQGNKNEIKWGDMEKAAETVMKNEKKLRYAAELLALNPSTAFCGGKRKERNREKFYPNQNLHLNV